MKSVPKSVGQYFVFPKNGKYYVDRSRIIARFKYLKESKYGYKTKEYKDLKRYLKR